MAGGGGAWSPSAMDKDARRTLDEDGGDAAAFASDLSAHIDGADGTPPPSPAPGGAAARRAAEAAEGVHVERGAAYAAGHDRQRVDVYTPGDARAPERAGAAPVLFHVHGGGWRRGARDRAFYGAPSVCGHAAQRGMVAVACGYRLGEWPGCVEDAALALKWTVDNAARLGGDPSAIFVSGHSAGGHLAAHLLLRHAELLAPLGVPEGCVKGVALISGVYSLFNPLGARACHWKNWVFAKQYVLPTFGGDEAPRRAASPLLLVDRAADMKGPGCCVVEAVRRRCSGSPEAHRHDPAPGLGALPPVLVLNAECDLGLEFDGVRMAAALVAAGVRTEHQTVPGTNHASICWGDDTADRLAAFVSRNDSRG